MPPIDLSVNLKYAELTILSMYEELQIVRATEDTEDDLKASVKQLGNTVTEADQLVSTYSCNKTARYDLNSNFPPKLKCFFLKC